MKWSLSANQDQEPTQKINNNNCFSMQNTTKEISFSLYVESYMYLVFLDFSLFSKEPFLVCTKYFISLSKSSVNFYRIISVCWTLSTSLGIIWTIHLMERKRRRDWTRNTRERETKLRQSNGKRNTKYFDGHSSVLIKSSATIVD